MTILLIAVWIIVGALTLANAHKACDGYVHWSNYAIAYAMIIILLCGRLE